MGGFISAGTVTGIETVIGSTVTDTVTGPNAATPWTITGAGAVSVGGISFTGIENLTGGTESDSSSARRKIAFREFADSAMAWLRKDGGIL